MAEQPQGALAQITDYELVALVELRRTPPALAVLDAVGVRELLDDATAQRAGISGLVARGLADLQGEELVVDGFAASLGTMVTTAGDVLRLDLLRRGELEGRTVLVGARVGALLLDVGALGVHTVQPLAAGVVLTDLVRDVLAEFGASEDVSAEQPLEVELTRFRAAGQPSSARLVVTGPDAWTSTATDATTASGVWAEVELLLGESDADVAARPRRAIAPDV